MFRKSIKERKCVELFKRVLKTENVIYNKGVFDFLIGDSNRRLRVDAYFPDFNLVVEYDGKQHTSNVDFFNKKQGRKKQRKKYD